MRWIKQSTAISVKWGQFVDENDGKTPETALVIQKNDVRLSKNSGNMAAANADQGASDAGAPHDEIGKYDGSLDATDTNTLGHLEAIIHKSGALPREHHFMVVPADVWDALFAGTGKGIHANLFGINDNIASPVILDRSARSIVRGTASGGTTTSITTSALDPSASATDQFKGRIVIFDKDTTTAALKGQATDITASSIAGVLTVTALTTAAASGDTFCIV